MKKTISVLALLLFFSAISVSAALNNQEETPEKKSVSLKEVSPFSYCCIPHKGPFTEIDGVIMKLMKAIQEQNIPPAGAMIGIYYNSPDEVKPEELKWEMGFPVSAQVDVQAPLEKKQWEFTHVATAVHTGPFEEVEETIIEILKWMQDNKLIHAGPVMERYLTIPTPDTKPEDLKTEVWIPYKKGEK